MLKDPELATLPIPLEDQLHIPEVGERLTSGKQYVELYSRAQLPTRFGNFTIFVFKNSLDHLENVALLKYAPENLQHTPLPSTKDALVRLHSECLTGDVFGSCRCDCREQLELALSELQQASLGLLLYLRQEGRGIGLGNKIKAYTLQEQGLDTFAANRQLGFADDERDYQVAAMILKSFNIHSITLATNNPRKIFGLRMHGINIQERKPLIASKNPHNIAYLQAKAKLDHLF